MKRLIVFILLALLLCGVNLSSVQKLTLDQIFPTATLEVYTSDKSYLDLNKLKNGNGEIIFADINQLNYITQNCQSVVGYTLIIRDMQKNDVLKALKVLYQEQENYGIYGWSSVLGFNKKIVLNGNNINFQCVTSGQNILIGVPILLGSY